MSVQVSLCALFSWFTQIVLANFDGLVLVSISMSCVYPLVFKPCVILFHTNLLAQPIDWLWPMRICIAVCTVDLILWECLPLWHSSEPTKPSSMRSSPNNIASYTDKNQSHQLSANINLVVMWWMKDFVESTTASPIQAAPNDAVCSRDELCSN